MTNWDNDGLSATITWKLSSGKIAYFNRAGIVPGYLNKPLSTKSIVNNNLGICTDKVTSSIMLWIMGINSVSQRPFRG